MSFAKIIFQKDIYDIKLADVENFFSIEQEETAILEFKSGQTKLSDVHREICAFLNTGGGLLIVGAPKEVKNSAGNKKVCKGSVIPSNFPNKDTVARSIASNISPAPVGFKVHEISIAGGGIFIIDVEQSLTPPHQVSDEGRYYIRLETEAKSAPHGIVESLFFKRQKPNLRMIVEITDTDSPDYINATFTLINESLYTAELIGYLIEIRGLNAVNKNQSTTGDYEIDAGTLTFQQSPIKDILVKGISITISFHVMPVGDIFLVDCIYWCKDIQAEFLTGIYDRREAKFININSSKRSDNEYSKEELIKAFDEISPRSFYDRTEFNNSEY